jgi:hypothetical protein
VSDLWIYDIETYKNVFTIAFEHAELPTCWSFEISNYRDDTPKLLSFLRNLKAHGCRLVGFNNVGFDYPVLHTLLRMGVGDAPTLYAKAMAIIEGGDASRFQHLVKPSDYYLPQIDLYKIHHFDNQAKRTSLKMLEFNMRSDNIVDLPFPVGSTLNQEQIKVLREYNAHDVSQTKKFYHKSKDMIAFRDELTKKYDRDFINHNDTKVGKDFFAMELERNGVQLYDYSPGKGRVPRQTIRQVINMRDAILPSITFERPEFTRVLDWMKRQTITETKGALKEMCLTLNKKGELVIKQKDVTATIDGFTFVFGTGGIHGSVSAEIVNADDEYTIIDLDVASYYPNLAITNGFYPEHLGASFVHIYKNLFEQRKQYPKKSAESQMLKLALNGVYGDSNNVYSVFYDPLFTMRITLNGQLLLCKLAEQLMKIDRLKIIQINTDGITVKVPCNRFSKMAVDVVCKWWQDATGLVLESVAYKKMMVRDVNNYIAVRENGTTKRKGAYEWQGGGWYEDGYNGWHQDASAPVVARVAEKVLVEGAPIRETIERWPDLHDFMYRTKLNRPMYLEWNGQQVQRITRYVVTKRGHTLYKMMPPLARDPEKWRRAEIKAGWKVQVCNDINDAHRAFEGGDSIDFDHYVERVEDLVMRLR